MYDPGFRFSRAGFMWYEISYDEGPVQPEKTHVSEPFIKNLTMSCWKELMELQGSVDTGPEAVEGRWREAEGRDMNFLANVTGFSTFGGESLVFDHLGRSVAVDFRERRLMILKAGTWEPLHHPVLEMLTLLYLGKINDVHPIGKDTVGCRDLKESHFFTGIHAFDLRAVTERYGKDPGAFAKAAARLGGSPVSMADAAFRLMPFPRVPLYYLLWAGDEEFEPRFSVLFDRSIELVFQADAVWALVNTTSVELVNAG